jgi:septin family protein
LNVFTSQGYGDHTNITRSVGSVCDELRRRLRDYALAKKDPLKDQRDTRIHLILYFVAPHRSEAKRRERV